jgi:hypothetical protein
MNLASWCLVGQISDLPSPIRKVGQVVNLRGTGCPAAGGVR